MSRRVRVSAVSFLNARPITWGLERGLGEDVFQLEFDLPSRCAARLAAGDVDLALIPTAAYREIEAQTSLRAVPGNIGAVPPHPHKGKRQFHPRCHLERRWQRQPQGGQAFFDVHSDPPITYCVLRIAYCVLRVAS